VDELESHRGAETMPGDDLVSSAIVPVSSLELTILDKNVQTLLDSQGGIKDDKAKAERQNIVTCTDFEEIADCTLGRRTVWSACARQE
jgi:hypothetical protein